jgi:hypothetical protein
MITAIKNHKVQNQNVMLGLDKLMEGKKASIFYSDPPWGQGNISYWQTINKRHNDINPQNIDYNDFLNQIFALASKHTSGAVLIEYGIKWEQDIIDIGIKHGLKHLGVAQITYKSGSRTLPHQLHFFVTNDYKYIGNITDTINKITNRTGLKCVIDAVQDFIVKDGIVLDPCCGLGMTAEMAMAVNMNFYGNELNAKRLNTTIAKLNK